MGMFCGHTYGVGVGVGAPVPVAPRDVLPGPYPAYALPVWTSNMTTLTTSIATILPKRASMFRFMAVSPASIFTAAAMSALTNVYVQAGAVLPGEYSLATWEAAQLYCGESGLSITWSCQILSLCK